MRIESLAKIAKMWDLAPSNLRRHRDEHVVSLTDQTEINDHNLRLAEEAQAMADRRAHVINKFETLLTHVDGFGLTTATPVQRAIARLADGQALGKFADDPGVIQAFGAVATWPDETPIEVGIICGVRCAKSMIAAAKAVHATQHVDCSRLHPGEIPRVSVISIKRDLAEPVLDHIRGHVHASAVLSSIFLREDKDSITLKHPSGTPIEIMAVAAGKTGSSTAARWSAGVICDEAPRWEGIEESVINYDDIVGVARPRLLPGAQIFFIGSPWAPRGPVYRIVCESWGKPSVARVICWAPAQLMNPLEFTPKKCRALELADPTVYRRDVLAQFCEGSDGMFTPEILDPCIRTDEPNNLPPEPGARYVAATDPATRGDAWPLVICRQHPSGGIDVVYREQWRGTTKRPLSPDYVLGEIRTACQRYGLGAVWADQYCGDALRDLAIQKGLMIHIEQTTVMRRVQQFDHLRALMQDRRLSIPDDPDMIADLRIIQRQTTQAAVSIVIPRTHDAGGKRHADYAITLALAASRPVCGANWTQMAESTPEQRLQSGLIDWGREQGAMQRW